MEQRNKHWQAIKLNQNENDTRTAYINSQKKLRTAIEKQEQTTTREKLEKLINEGGIKCDKHK